MKELKWIESKAKEYNRINGELNGNKAVMISKSFKGNLPYRMIKALRNEANNEVIKLDSNGSWARVRFSSKKGKNYSEIYINRVVQ